MIRRFCVALCVVVVLGRLELAPACGAPPEGESSADAKQIAELEKSLTGSALVGHFTDSSHATDDPQPERYELGQVRHLGKGQWLLQARIRYGDADIPVPLTLPIRWAGDTPVICVDDLAIPGLGTFSARVMIYRDRYAGFWSGKDHGGHLFGAIERPKSTDAETPKAIAPRE